MRTARPVALLLAALGLLAGCADATCDQGPDALIVHVSPDLDGDAVTVCYLEECATADLRPTTGPGEVQIPYEQLPSLQEALDTSDAVVTLEVTGVDGTVLYERALQPEPNEDSCGGRYWTIST